MADACDVWEELSFLAAPDRVGDWRMVLLYGLVAETGMFDELPATAPELAGTRDLDADGVRVVLQALATWEVVVEHDGLFSLGPRFPGVGTEEALVLRHHARSMRLWCEKLPERLGVGTGAVDRSPGRGRWGLDVWLDALAVNARCSAPDAVEACLRRMPQARTVLDVGGGHGEYALEFARRGLEATMLDRSPVVDLAHGRGRLEAAGVRLYGADFFETLPGGPFDLVFCAGVSYTFDGGRNRELFGRVRPLLAMRGRLAVHTFLRGQDPRAAIFAVQMSGLAGGDTHSEAEYRQWLAETGYRDVEIVRLSRPPESLVLASR